MCAGAHGTKFVLLGSLTVDGPFELLNIVVCVSLTASLFARPVS